MFQKRKTALTVPEEIAPGANSGGARRRKIPLLLLLALALTLTLTGTLAYLVVHHHGPANQLAFSRVSGLPADVPTSVANTMSLSPVPSHPAPNFTLVDQRGRTLSLAGFRGRPVVLEFMDPHCVDICPIVSQEFVDAYHDLGGAHSHVVFLAVNVNQYFTSVADVERFSVGHQLTSIGTWHFLTGSPSKLRSVWRQYGVEVLAPNPRVDIVHTSVMYFIDPSGHERYIAVPIVNHTATKKAFLPAPSLTAWGRGIALVARNLAG